MTFTGLLFMLAFVVGCGAALVRHPVYGLVTYMGVFYLHPSSRWWGQGVILDIRWSLIAAGVTLIAIWLNPPKQSTAPVFKSGFFWGFTAFIFWILIQRGWALDPDAHGELFSLYVKFLAVIYMICKSIDSEESLATFCWAHVLGCFYLGWLAFTSYSGGRFEGFGGPGLGDANAAALHLVTGIMVAGSLFLGSGTRAKIALFGLIPIILNAVVTTISRSGFLAIVSAGLSYLIFAPAKHRRKVAMLSALAVVLFVLLTNPIYWARIGTLKYGGEEVEGVDTGGGRLVVIAAQWEMFKERPLLGCGHMCTTALSPAYLDESRLSDGARASHNTFMSMLVDHGVLGGLFYLAAALWIVVRLWTVASRISGQPALIALALPAVAAALGAIWIGDLFAQYTKFEGRIWFVSLLIVLMHLTQRQGESSARSTLRSDASTTTGRRPNRPALPSGSAAPTTRGESPRRSRPPY